MTRSGIHPAPARQCLRFCLHLSPQLPHLKQKYVTDLSVAQDLQGAVHRERTAATKAAAAGPAKQVWRTVMPPYVPAGMAAPRQAPTDGTPAWLPQPQPGSLLDRVMKGLSTVLSREGLTTYIVPAVTAGIFIWAFGPKQQYALPPVNLS